MWFSNSPLTYTFLIVASLPSILLQYLWCASEPGWENRHIRTKGKNKMMMITLDDPHSRQVDRLCHPCVLAVRLLLHDNPKIQKIQKNSKKFKKKKKQKDDGRHVLSSSATARLHFVKPNEINFEILRPRYSLNPGVLMRLTFMRL